MHLAPHIMLMSKDNSPIEQLQNQNLIVFDGECVLCSSFFNFIVRADTQEQFNFAIAQSDFGERLYAYYDLKAEDYDTNLIFINGKLYERLAGFFTAMRLLGWPYNALAVFGLLPDKFLDWAYYKIARNRYQWFGRRDVCLIPSPELRGRFIND